MASRPAEDFGFVGMVLSGDQPAVSSVAQPSIDNARGRHLTCWLLNSMVKQPTAPDTLDAIFGALADPTRRAILTRLAAGQATVTELAEPWPISLPAISRHLKVLEHAGLIERDRAAQFRPSRLRGERLVEAARWVDTCRQLWESRLDRLDQHIQSVQGRKRK